MPFGKPPFTTYLKLRFELVGNGLKPFPTQILFWGESHLKGENGKKNLMKKHCYSICIFFII